MEIGGGQRDGRLSAQSGKGGDCSIARWPSVTLRSGPLAENGFQASDQIADIDRLAKKSQSAAAQGRIPGAFILVGGYEYHRRMAATPVQLALQLYAGQTGHFHIHDDAVDARLLLRLQKMLGRCKQAAFVTEGHDEIIHGFADSGIVVDDGNDGNGGNESDLSVSFFLYALRPV